MNRSRILSSLAMTLLTGSTLLAAGMPCSVHPKKGAKKDELAAMAKVSQDDAKKAAVASLKDSSKATVKEAELEAEHGSLVYSFAIGVEGEGGGEGVMVEAGTGKVLSSKHESAKAEAAEKKKDKTKPPSR